MRLLFLILSISITGALCMRNNQGDGNADDFGRGDNVRRNKRSSTEIHPGNAGDSERDNSVRPNKRIRKSTNNYQDYLYEDSFGYELLEDDFFEPHLLGTNSLKNTLAKDTSYEDESYEDNSHDANSSDDSFIDGDFSENDSTDDTNFKRKSANHFEKNEKEKTSRKVVAKDRKMRASRKGEKSHLGKFLQAADKKNFNFHIFQYVPGNIVVSKKGKEAVYLI